MTDAVLAIPEVLRPIAPIYNWLLTWFMPWGLALLFLTSMMENWPVVGFVTPGVVMIAAAAFLGSAVGVSPVVVGIVAVAGSIAGVLSAYLLGKRLGLDGLRGLIRWWNGLGHMPRFLRMNVQFVDDLHEYFQTHGKKTALAAQFAYGVKAFIPPVAGAANMPFAGFFAGSLAGSALYTAILAFAGWFLQKNAHLATKILSGMGGVGSVVFVLLVVFVLWALRRIALRRQARKGQFVPLETMTDVFKAAGTGAGADFAPISRFVALPSTNDFLKDQIAAGALTRADGRRVVIAEEQSAGRGQFDRGWVSPAGGLYMSILVWPARTSRDWAQLSMLTVEALATALAWSGVEDLHIKHPNDLYLRDGKLAGVLLESDAAAGWVVIGIGLNVARVEGLPVGAAATNDIIGATTDKLARRFLDEFAEDYLSWNGQ
ncbi:MAG: biotin--[acetyl-CoA-carboxylase] ligase [Actinomycetes bacterium]|jgi:biotin-[acetyl-CoA-carboxylase] ligase BirA-like protein|nr:biotin--[acetyl-CoA-carboxylase] ligase [Actinomycetes bacterium]